MRIDLERYIYDEIVPRYGTFDQAHREDHALAVIGQAMALLDEMPHWLDRHPEAAHWRVPVSRDMLLTAAACHDLGLANGRERHHLDSGTIIRNDAMLRQWFDDEQIEVIAQAAEDHRASGRSEPRSIYGMLVAEADRLIDGDTIIRRTMQFGLKNCPQLDRQGHIVRAVGHLREKYGHGGYLRLWIPWSDNAARLAALQDMIADDEAVAAAVARQYDILVVPRKIYFAGSIRGGRIDADLYRRMIEYMQKTDIVLTEHIGRPDLNLLEQGKGDEDIYSQDTVWLRESDVVIAECTCPSLGVGYELAYAESHGKPCHIFYDAAKTQLSAMLKGNPYFHVHPYRTEHEIYAALNVVLSHLHE